LPSVDVLVVGAGPAGSTAARVAAEAGLKVLIVERKSCVGIPVQCAEYVPAQIAHWAPIPAQCVAQPIENLCTYLPDGETIQTTSRGFVLQRALYDKALAAIACRAGAAIQTGTRALRPVPGGVVVRCGDQESVIGCTVIVGADGPQSTVGQWIGQTNQAFLVARQAETVLSQPEADAFVYFDPMYRGGYGWLFPKGTTANVGVAVNPQMGGDPNRALEHLLARLSGTAGAVLGTSGGLVPSGGEAARLWSRNTLLVGDAAGQTHPITGGGILPAVAAGTLAGRAAAQAVKGRKLELLASYAAEWASFMGPALHRALAKRQHLDANWSEDPKELTLALRQDWIAFPGYWKTQEG
jgi:digeranylgeranylglycerophospholipid reductase